MRQPKDIEQRIKSDFLFFLFLIWKHLGLPKPTHLQADIAMALVNAPKRLIIEAFRGCGKSFITSAFVVWMLYRNPKLKIMVVSASKERADAFSSFTKRLIADVPWLAHLKPKAGQRDSLISFDVGPAGIDHSPSVKSVGITGQLTGSRADIIIADDIEVTNNSFTQQAREKLAELVKEFDAILKPYDPQIMDSEPKVIFLGTPQTEMSLYNTLGDDRGYKTMIWPAQYPKNIDAYKNKLAPWVYEKLERDASLIGKPTDPQRFSIEDLKERKASYGKAGYSLQFMLDTSLSDAEKYPLKLNDLIIQECSQDKAPTEYAVGRKKDNQLEELPTLGLAGDYFYRPEWINNARLEYQSRILVIDPSGRGTDETAYMVLKLLNGNIHLVEAGGYRDGYSDNVLESLSKVAKRHKVNKVVIEDNFGDGMFNQLLKPHLNRIYPCSIHGEKNFTQKERRIIDTLEPVLMQHRLIVDPSVVEKDYEETKDNLQYSLFYQLTRITYERGCLGHDDRLDCLAIGVAFFLKSLSVDAHKLELQRQQEEIDKLLYDTASCFSSGASVVSSIGEDGVTTVYDSGISVAGY